MIRSQQFLHRVSEDKRVVPIVEPKLEFVKVTVKMLHADSMIRADDRPLEQGPRSLNRIRVNVSANPLFFGVVDLLVLRILIRPVAVSGVFVRIDRRRIFGDMLQDEPAKSLAVRLLRHLEANFSVTLDRANDQLLFGPASTLARSLAARPSTDVGLINLDYPTQERVRGLERMADSVAEIPSSSVGDLKASLELIRANRLLGFDHHVDGKKPLPERKVRIVHDRLRSHAKLIPARVTIILVAILHAGNRLGFAAWARDAFGPAQGFQVTPAIIFGAESLN